MNKITPFVMLASAGLGIAALVGCKSMPVPTHTAGTISQATFGYTAARTPVEIYTLRNSRGMEARIMTYGGIVQSLQVPDKSGNFDDVVLGYDNLEGYLTNNPYFGCLVGRYGNRIGGARFALEGKTYTLATNNGPNSLHGGIVGFDKVIWKAKTWFTPDGPALELSYISKDGEEGFPGNLKVTAIYTLTENNELHLDFSATTDQPTLCNLTHHSYFNLRGQGNGDILGHDVYINADQTTPVDKELITTGELKAVDGTPFDFRKPVAIGARINDPDQQLQFGPGYDHNWVINKPLDKSGKPQLDKLVLQARVYEPTTGRTMEVWSTEPGLQFYAGNFLDGTIIGKEGKVYPRRSGFCMEPQHYPDSPNKPMFPSTELKPGTNYRNTIVYRFSAQ